MKIGRSTLQFITTLFLLTGILAQPAVARQDKLSKTQLLTHDPDIYDWLYDARFDKIPFDRWYNRQLGLIMLGISAEDCFSRDPRQRQRIGKRKALVLNMAVEGEASDKPPDALMVFLPEVIILNTAFLSARAYLKANDGCGNATVQQTLNNLIDLIVARGDRVDLIKDSVETGNLKESELVSIRSALHDELSYLEIMTGQPREPIITANRLEQDWGCCFVNGQLLSCRYSVGDRHLISRPYHFWYKALPAEAIADVRNKELDEDNRLSLFGSPLSECPATETAARTLLGLGPRKESK